MIQISVCIALWREYLETWRINSVICFVCVFDRLHPLQRSFMGLLLVTILVSSDFHTWKEGVTIAAPDSAPLFAMVAIFGES